MKLTITLFTLLLATASFAQKAKSTGTNKQYRHMHYPENIELSAKFWTVQLTEQSAGRGAIPYSVKQSPLSGADKRSAFYIGLIGNRGQFYYQAKDLITNLDVKQTPYIHYDLNVSDILILNQQTKNKRIGAPEPQFNLIFEMRTPISLKITHKGDFTQLMLDTTNRNVESHWFSFPKDAQLGTAPDIKPNGYPTEAELLAAWRKYGQTAELQWRDKMIRDFLTPVCFNFTKEYIQYEEWDVVKIYSDKNKKGGYDHIVQAAEVFENTLAEIDADYKSGNFNKFYTDEYQRRLNDCKKTWKDFLGQYDFDVVSDDGDVDADYKQKMLLNYIHALIFTKEFEEAQKQITHYIAQDIRNVTRDDLKSLERLNAQFQKEYNAHAERFGWK